MGEPAFVAEATFAFGKVPTYLGLVWLRPLDFSPLEVSLLFFNELSDHFVFFLNHMPRRHIFWPIEVRLHLLLFSFLSSFPNLFNFLLGFLGKRRDCRQLP